MRFNFNNKRGNIMGIYMDLGAAGDWNYSLTHFEKETKNGIKSKTKSRGYDFISPFSYGPVVRFGYNQFAVSAAYRYSNIFEKSANFPELPRFLLGFELSII